MSKENDKHEKWMRVALAQARYAAEKGEVPIGAVLVKNDRVIAKAHNLRELHNRAAAHAELLVIDQANQILGQWRLSGCSLYVTLEPCPMCAGAMILSRVDEVIFAAKDPKGGCAGSLMNLLTDPRFNHQPRLESGILEEEASRLLTSFFKGLRARNKAAKQAQKQAEEDRAVQTSSQSQSNRPLPLEQ
ncbi:TPA: tRNA adenosine(34) deaminase TadA [Streptococcus suis]